MNNTVILAALAKAEDGTVFQAGKGAPCPVCGMRSKVVGSPKWEGRLITDAPIRTACCAY